MLALAGMVSLVYMQLELTTLIRANMNTVPFKEATTNIWTKIMALTSLFQVKLDF